MQPCVWIFVQYAYTMHNNYKCTTFETFDVGNYLVLINKVPKGEPTDIHKV